MFTIKRFLETYGLDPNSRVKIVKHKDEGRGINIQKLYDSGHFELYQSYQEQDNFKDCDVLLSCIGLEKNQALFVGAYRVKDKVAVTGFPEDMDVPFQGKAKMNSKFKYILEKMDEFQEFENRIIVQWMKARHWCINISTGRKPDFEVVQVLPKGYVKEFPGYIDFILTYKELREIYKYPDANSVWRNNLSSVGGVYLIVDTFDGKQYVGSAGGAEGIYGRWRDYAKNGHGENKELKTLLHNDPDRINSFQYTLLELLPKGINDKEIKAAESKYKLKLLTRKNGHNRN